MNIEIRRAVFAALLFPTLVFLPSCGSDDGTPTQVTPPPTPVVNGLSATVLSPGDTLGISGKNFARATTSNRVVFNNDLARAIPFFSAGDSLAVEVPPYANSGPLYVTSKGVASATTPVEVRRSIGDVWVIGGSASFDFKLPAPTAGKQYLMIPYSASGGGIANFSYTVSSGDATVFPAPARPAATADSPLPFPQWFETDTRRQAIEYIERYGHGRRPRQHPRRMTPPPGTTTFRVLKCAGEGCSTTNAANYATVTATLRYNGAHALVYSDDNQPTNSFTQTDYDAFGMQFDAQIFPSDSMFFGSPSDIDGNGRAIILFTPQVNDLTPNGTAHTQGFISGFFLFNDIAPGIVPAGTSNAAEIFYVMVPDPNNEYGNDFTQALVKSIVPGTLAHEFEHMISFGYRFLNFGVAALQQTWLEEGMAHMAEDLNGMVDDNRRRANLYLVDPGGVSLIGSDTLAQRGGIFLFLRYLGDRLGESIYRTILQNACLGRTCVESVSGTGFFTSVADFLATLYLSDRGITANPAYNFTSFNMQTFFDSTLQVMPRSVGSGSVNGSVRNAAGDFYLWNGFQPPAAGFTVNGAASGKVRAVVVQTQ